MDRDQEQAFEIFDRNLRRSTRNARILKFVSAALNVFLAVVAILLVVMGIVWMVS